MDRDIYCYSNGQREVKADPLVLRDQLYVQSQGQYAELIAKLRAIDAAKEDVPTVMEGIAARGHLDSISRAVFGLQPFDDTNGSGVTREQSLAILFNFITWLNQKKTSSAQQPTTLPPTASTTQPSPTITPITSG